MNRITGRPLARIAVAWMLLAGQAGAVPPGVVAPVPLATTTTPGLVPNLGGMGGAVMSDALGRVSSPLSRPDQRTPAPTDDGTLTGPYVAAGSAVSLNITNGGTGYTTAPTLTFPAVSGIGCTAPTAAATVSGGVITGVLLTSAGSCETPGMVLLTASGGGGSGAVVRAVISNGSLWQASGRVWQMQRSGNAQAAWTLVQPSGLPCDVIATNQCFGMQKLRAAYAGSWGILTRASDSTTATIAFLPNGQVDAGAADQFCLGTTCYITTLYDQSPNAYNWTATAGTTAPQWLPNDLIGTFRVFAMNTIPHSNGAITQVNKTFTMSSSFSWTPSTSNWFVAGQVSNALESRNLLQNASNIGFLTSYQPSGIGMGLEGEGIVVQVAVDNGPAVLTFSWQAGNFLAWSNNGLNGKYLNPTVTAATGGTFGSSVNASPQVGRFLAVIEAATLTQAQITAEQVALYRTFNIAPQADSIVVMDGDSSFSGEGSTLGYSTPLYAALGYSIPSKIENVSVFGAELAAPSGLATTLPNFAKDVTPLYSPAYRNFVVGLSGGINDLRQGATVAQVEAGVQAYGTLVHALGPNAKFILVLSPLQCDVFNSGTLLPEFVALENWIATSGTASVASGGAGADAVANLYLDPTVGPNTTAASAFCSNTANSVDGAHPTDLVMNYEAAILSAAVNSVLH